MQLQQSYRLDTENENPVIISALGGSKYAH